MNKTLEIIIFFPLLSRFGSETLIFFVLVRYILCCFRSAHPNEDPNDLREHGLVGISQMFGEAADTVLVVDILL